MAIDSDLDAHAIASVWLSALASALERGDVSAITMLFLPDGWLRDALVLHWDLRTLEGRDKIATYLADSLETGQLTKVQLDDTPELAPRVCEVPFMPHTSCVEFGFQFGLPYGHGRGVARLMQDSDDSATFRAFTVFWTLQDLLPLGDDDATAARGRDAISESDAEMRPTVLIVGGGQSGLAAAARFKQMNIPSVVIEKTARIGDVWRMRYPTLTIQSTRRHCTLLYQPYPSTWPEFMPRDDLADWLEQYVAAQSLTVWTSSELRAHPRYDDRTGRWDVTVDRAGVEVKLHPAHIVIATGMLGRPAVPAFAGLEQFSGQYMHSADFPGGSLFAGKRAVVVGAANSAIDVCVDFACKGAESVTMVQRSSTCVLTREFFNKLIKPVFPEDEPLEVSDMKFAALPLALQEKLVVANKQLIVDTHKEVFDDLRNGGVNLADVGCNPYVMFFCKRGGFWLDTGGAPLISSGRIKVESGKSVERFTETGLILSDGTELIADVVIFATGYNSIRESNADWLGQDVMKRVGPVGELDQEGEIKGLFRPCGHPGLWFAGGDFFYPRCFSNQLGLQIQAIEMGILRQGSLP